MHSLAACLCFKDTAQYLEEWLLFHHVQGFDYFYLYNNDSSDEWRGVVEPWVRRGLASVVDFPGAAMQARIYDDCLARARGEAKWLAFLDDDEFLFPSADEPLLSVLDEYDAAAGVGVSWVLMGSGGAERQEPGWVTRRFQASAGGPDAHLKCVVRPERVERSLVIGHSFEPKPGFHIVDELGRVVEQPLNPSPTARRLRINHYLIKSWEESRLRRSRRQADTGAPTPHPEAKWREWDQYWSGVRDTAAVRLHGKMLERAKEMGLKGES